jgi:hypothetical protein
MDVHQRRLEKVLLGTAVVTALLYVIPFGGFVIWPLMLFSTLAHEAGHGIAASAMGGTFESFVMFADGSGMARSSGVASGWPRAFTAAGGLIGPAVVGAIGFAFARRLKASRVALVLAALTLAALEVLVVDNAFGYAFVGACALVLGWIALRRPAWSQAAVVFVSVQLALSVFSRGDYLFTDVAVTGAGNMPSDVANMATALGGPYWLWGAACGALSVLVLCGGLWLSLRRGRRSSGFAGLERR